ncbi:MAG: carboxypeptidase-like regulatory domain-containing protein [Spirochaetota bacterium]|nr:carboxypeptidase-like regulatory domain-containing protein [Spirochaetota bacterium]
MSSTMGVMGDVSSSENEYWATIKPPSSGAGSATVMIKADGVSLNTSLIITFADPFTDMEGGSGGCAAEGNVRVLVVDESGNPIPDAYVMIGDSEVSDIYITSYNKAPDGSNVGRTDADGFVEFHDLGVNLNGPLTITAAADSRQYLTFIDIDASDFIIPLAPIYPIFETGILYGDIYLPETNDIEVGIMLRDMSINSLTALNLNTFVSEFGCYPLDIPVYGNINIALPGNIYIPKQCALGSLFCLLTLPEHKYISGHIE